MSDDESRGQNDLGMILAILWTLSGLKFLLLKTPPSCRSFVLDRDKLLISSMCLSSNSQQGEQRSVKRSNSLRNLTLNYNMLSSRLSAVHQLSLRRFVAYFVTNFKAFGRELCFINSFLICEETFSLMRHSVFEFTSNSESTFFLSQIQNSWWTNVKSKSKTQTWTLFQSIFAFSRLSITQKKTKTSVRQFSPCFNCLFFECTRLNFCKSLKMWWLLWFFFFICLTMPQLFLWFLSRPVPNNNCYHLDKIMFTIHRWSVRFFFSLENSLSFFVVLSRVLGLSINVATFVIVCDNTNLCTLSVLSIEIWFWETHCKSDADTYSSFQQKASTNKNI